MPKAAAHGVHTHTGRGLPLRRLPAMDLPFLVLVLTLVGFGLVMLEHCPQHSNLKPLHE